MEIWTLYDNPADHEKRWVVRLSIVTKKGLELTNTLFGSDSREECEDYVMDHSPGLVWMVRSPKDIPHIVGTWI